MNPFLFVRIVQRIVWQINSHDFLLYEKKSFFSKLEIEERTTPQ
jgi:hypothetical protein